MDKTKDPVNQELVEYENDRGLSTLGVMSNMTWGEDPRRLVITLSRYKFVAKMFSGIRRVAEIGCGDGFGSRIVRQEVGHLLITDYDPYFIGRFQGDKEWPVEARVHDILSGPLVERYDALYSLDVMEHISVCDESRYLENVCMSLVENGCAIIGMPSLESQRYASPASKAGHVNCKTGGDLVAVLKRYFSRVFLFSMNDEVVHTGYSKMAHYLLALCVNPRNTEH